MRVVENDAPNDFEGGRLVFKPVRAGADPALLDASLVIAAKTDVFLMLYPWKTRAAKSERFYRLTLVEIAVSDLPPDPATVPDEIAELEARLRALRGS